MSFSDVYYISLICSVYVYFFIKTKELCLLLASLANPRPGAPRPTCTPRICSLRPICHNSKPSYSDHPKNWERSGTQPVLKSILTYPLIKDHNQMINNEMVSNKNLLTKIHTSSSHLMTGKPGIIMSIQNRLHIMLPCRFLIPSLEMHYLYCEAQK